MKCLMLALAMFGTMAIMGCESDPSNLRSRQDAALRDPFTYSPYDEKDPRPDITGGGTTEFNGKSMQRDLNHVFGP